MRLLTVFIALLLFFWASGSSAQTSTWTDLNQDITIPAGQTVTLDSIAYAKTLTVNGTLKVSRAVSTQLHLGCNLIVNGTLDMGTAADPIATVTHETVFHLSPAEAAGFVGGGAFEPTDCGLWDFGTWTTAGRPVLRTWGKLAADVPVGATSVTVDGDVSDWPVGGQIVLTQTTHGCDYRADGVCLLQYQTEVRTIAGVNGSTLTLDAPLLYARSGTGEFRGDVGLLSHTVTIRTELESPGDIDKDVRTRLFAHTICMPGSTCVMQFTAFRWMGHYGSEGRYPMHRHRQHDGSRGADDRGNSCYQTGFRCTNVHQSNGVVVQDWVTFQGGDGNVHNVQNDWPETTADVAHVHNLTVSGLSKQIGDRSNPAIAGDRGRNASGFWPGMLEHEWYLGNVVAGPPPVINDVTHGYTWPENNTSRAGSIGQVFAANEAHSLVGDGLHSWQNRLVPFTLIHPTVWGTDQGFVHGAYRYPAYTYGARIAGTRLAVWQTSDFAWMQDAHLSGMAGFDATVLPKGDRAIYQDGYVSSADLWIPSKYWRYTVDGLQAGADGPPIVVSHRQGPCPAGSNEILWETQPCTANAVWFKPTRVPANAVPFLFQAPRNANTFWVDLSARRLLFRADQVFVPTGQMTPDFVRQGTVIDTGAQAATTALGLLPPSFTWIVGSTPPVTVTLEPDEPPSVSLTVSLSGSVATMRATASADTQVVRFWVDGLLVATDLTVPYEATVDLAQLAAVGDQLAPRTFAYLYAEARDGVTVNDWAGDHRWAYAQRAYSEVIELTPEMRRALQPPVDPTVAELQQQLATMTAERDVARQLAQQSAGQVSGLQSLITTLDAQIAQLAQAIQAVRTALAGVP